jgi:hypothetical protein
MKNLTMYKAINPTRLQMSKPPRLFVISDLAKVKSYSHLNMDMRYVYHDNKPFIVSSTNEELLKLVKDKNDPYHITELKNYMLVDYCQRLSYDILLITSCYCDMQTKKIVMNWMPINGEHINEISVKI